MKSNKLKYAFYIIGFILILAPIFMTELFRSSFGDFTTKLILSIGCVIVGCGKIFVIVQKKELEMQYSTDIILMIAFFALAGFNLIK